MRAALIDAERATEEAFSPSPQQQEDIHAKLEYLARKVAELDKFNWKRLFITTLVGVSVDLGFGTLIPTALLEIFKQIFSHLAERLLKRGDKPSRR